MKQNGKSTRGTTLLPERTAARSGALDRNCIHDRICWAILDRISDGSYQPGERLKELTLAHEFQVSQAPVREAIRKLEAIGVLESAPYRGTHVRTVSLRELKDTYQLRGILEQVATEFIREFTASDVQYLEEEYAAMQASVGTGDFQATTCHNRNFHRHIVHHCENAEVVRIWESLQMGYRSRLNMQRMLGQLPQAIATHQPIIDAFRAGDLQRAGRILREHSFQMVEDID